MCTVCIHCCIQTWEFGVPQGNTVGWGVRDSLWRPNGLAQQLSAGQRLASFLPEGWLLSASMAVIGAALAARWKL